MCVCVWDWDVEIITLDNGENVAKASTLRPWFFNFNVHKKYPGGLKIKFQAPSRDFGILDLRRDPEICILQALLVILFHPKQHVSRVEIVTDLNDKSLIIQIQCFRAQMNARLKAVGFTTLKWNESFRQRCKTFEEAVFIAGPGWCGKVFKTDKG